MANSNLTNAKKAKNDEFYTQYHDIEKEISAYLEYNPDVFKWKTILLPCDDPEWSNFTKFFAQNFETFGLKKIISTSFASNSKNYDSNYQATLFEKNDEKYDENKTTENGKIFTLTRDITWDWRIDFKDLEWEYLKWDWDFNSDEIKSLRDEADIIITNPPFSLFRDFLAWIIEADKKFLLIWSLNAISYKEVFPLIKDIKLWLWPSISSGDREFEVPESVIDMEKFTGEIRNGKYYQRVMWVRWFTNLDHGRRHQKLPLMTESDIVKFTTKKPFEKYDNYDAIEVSYVKNIPSDYNWVMGVPISFLDKYSPEQFDIVGFTAWRDEYECIPSKRYINALQHNSNWTIVSGSKANTRATLRLKEKPNGIYYTADNSNWPLSIVYARILIKHKK